MGFVYNNPMEALCTSYLEMQGYFVINNLRPFVLEHDEPKFGYEADLVAYRLANTAVPHVDAAGPDPAAHEFFPAAAGVDDLVYCEIKANIALTNDQQMVRDLVNEGAAVAKVKDKAERIRVRFGRAEPPRVVLMANRVIGPHRATLGGTHGWLFKEFLPMYRFMVDRFRLYPQQKGRVQYNDPWLEMFRFLQRHSLAATGGFPFPEE